MLKEEFELIEIYKIDVSETSIEDEYVTQVQTSVKLLSDSSI